MNIFKILNDKLRRKKEVVEAFEPNLKTNTSDNEELHSTIGGTLEKIANTVRSSYGPLGANTIIRQGGGEVPKLTKDGLSILRRIVFEDPMANDIHKLITKISNELVLRVGDGSTSAIVISNEIYKRLYPISKQYQIKNELLGNLNKIEKWSTAIIKEFLTESYKDNDVEVLKKIASLSTNNDEEIGSQIAQIVANYTKESSIRIELKPNDEEGITHRAIYGFKTNRDYTIPPVFVKEGSAINLHNPLVFACYSFGPAQKAIIDNFIYQSQSTNNVKPNVVIISETWQPDLLRDYQFGFVSKETQNIIPVQVKGIISEHQSDYFYDLCTYLNCDPDAFNSITMEDIEKGNLDLTNVVGHCRLATFDGKEIVFEGGFGNEKQVPKFENLVNRLQKELDETPTKLLSVRSNLRSRLDRLNGIHCTIFVGGRTSEEKETLRYLVEDAVLACQSVMKHGYAIGGNYNGLYALILLKHIIRMCTANDPISETPYYVPNANEVVDNIYNEITGELSVYEVFRISILVNELIEAYLNVNKDVLPESLLDSINSLKCSKTKLTFSKKDGNYDLNYNYYDGIKAKAKLYNIKNDKCENIYDTRVISPVMTDIDIMSTSFSIVGLLLNSNKYVF